eukprot:gene18696-24453_t
MSENHNSDSIFELNQIHSEFNDKIETIEKKDITVDNDKKDNKEDKAHYRYGKHKDKTLLQKLRTSLYRLQNENKLNRINEKLHKNEQDEKRKDEIIQLRYATDLSFRHNENTTVDQIWDAIMRREAWAQKPLHMIGVSFAQIAICFIVVLSPNSSINPSTVVMAVLFIFGIAASNSFDVTKDLYVMINRDIIIKYKISNVAILLSAVFLWPVYLSVLSVVVALDLLIGEIVDISYGGLVNNMVNIIVVFSAISVGLRSGNAVSAIQTFAGFDFVNQLDEAVMACTEVDYLAATSTVHSDGKKRKILTVRILTYILTPLIILAFLYITVTNACVVFCSY